MFVQLKIKHKFRLTLNETTSPNFFFLALFCSDPAFGFFLEKRLVRQENVHVLVVGSLGVVSLGCFRYDGLHFKASTVQY